MGEEAAKVPVADNGNESERRTALSAADWVSEARRILVTSGIASVKIGQIAKALNVSREAFYWHFKGLEALHKAMLLDWEVESSRGYRQLIDPAARNGLNEFFALNRMWVSEIDHYPAWDEAVRDWARNSPMAAFYQGKIDVERVGIIREMFLDMGEDFKAATVRARIAYCQQVGYYAVGFHETRDERLGRFSLYVEFLAGRVRR